MSRVVRKERRLLSVEEYIASKVLSYPTLYAYKDKEVAKFAILDQLFNVIGNGIRDELEFKREVYVLKEVVIDFDRAQRYVNEPVFTGYLAMKKVGRYSFPDSSQSINHILEDEKHLHPEVVEWQNHKPTTDTESRTPYPNFQEQYSLVYHTDLKEVTSQEWVDAAIWYYDQCLKFFNSSNSSQYHYAYPRKDESDTEYQLRDMKERLENQYKGDFESISQAYLTPFDGDVDKFLRLRWNNELSRIKLFIESTLKKLKS